jgi:hypothetical protein
VVGAYTQNISTICNRCAAGGAGSWELRELDINKDGKYKGEKTHIRRIDYNHILFFWALDAFTTQPYKTESLTNLAQDETTPSITGPYLKLVSYDYVFHCHDWQFNCIDHIVSVYCHAEVAL